MGSEKKIPYKIYLKEDELPKSWYNVRADMKNKPAPLLNPATLKPMTADDLKAVFCDELIAQELDETNAYIPIPEEIVDFYKMYRPSPLVRAYCLEKKLQTPAKIYYKFEGNNTSGSHKLNSAIAQAYYAKKQGLKGVTTETGAGQWGTALSMACSYFGLDCQVYMVKVSYEQKPFRREVMRTYGAKVTPSPSTTTEVGKKILAEHPGTIRKSIRQKQEKGKSHVSYESEIFSKQDITNVPCRTAYNRVMPKYILSSTNVHKKTDEQTAREKNNSFHEKKFVNSKHRITFATPNFNGGFI